MDQTQAGPRWARIEAAWIDPSVGADGIAVLAVLVLHANEDGVCWPSQGRIAALLGRSRAWVIAVLDHLEGLGIVTRWRRHRSDGGLSSCGYQLAAAPAGAKPVAAADTPCRLGDRNLTQKKVHTPPPSPGAAADGPALPSTGPRPEEDDGVGAWCPGEGDLAWAQATVPTADLVAHTARFLARCRLRGYRYANPSAAWRRWLIEDCDVPARPRARSSARSRPDGDLSLRNAAAADACRRRLLERRAAG